MQGEIMNNKDFLPKLFIFIFPSDFFLGWGGFTMDAQML